MQERRFADRCTSDVSSAYLHPYFCVHQEEPCVRRPKTSIFAAVKRLAGILFISIYMLAFAECHQLLRIPFLIEHYDFHKKTDPQISFMKFLNIHYLGPIIVDDDFTQDQQLPFRDVDSHTMIGSLVVSSEPPVFTIDPPELTSAVFYTYNELNIPQFKAFDIFQPPRCA